VADGLNVSGSAAPPQKNSSVRQFNFNTVAAVLFIILAVVIYLIIPSQIDKPLIKLGASQSDLPPELFPQLVAIAFGILGLWYLWRSFNLRQRNELRDLDREAIVNVEVTFACMAAYVFLMVALGFVLGSAIMVFGLSTFFGNRNFWLSGAVAVLIPMTIFFVFRHFLLVELPPFPIDIYPLTNWSLI
jgi:hypothetical protein